MCFCVTRGSVRIGEARLAEWLTSRCETVRIRGLDYNLRRWGPDGAAPMMLLHGTQDSSATFQFLVEAFANDWSIVAPDWRGHGLSDHLDGGYWFHDFVADLDSLLDLIFPDRPIPLVGHSLGGNIAGIYAGLRPDRLTHLVSLDGFGPLTDRVPVNAHSLLDGYLRRIRHQRQHRAYASPSAVARRLIRANPRLSEDKARFLVEHSTEALGDGSRVWRFDPGHQASLPTLHDMGEWTDIWARIKVPVLWLSSTDKRAGSPCNDAKEFAARAGAVPGLRHEAIAQTGHNLHHDAPRDVAGFIERFCLDKKGCGRDGLTPFLEPDSG